MKRNFKKGDIAIIGMSGIFPKARNLEEYWSNLEQGLDCISKIPYERWDNEKFYSTNKCENNKTYSCWGGIIENAYEFDPMFFNISPKEAPMLDPQQRKSLEVAYETIENAGYSAKSLENSDTGVYLGVMGRGYFDNIIANNKNLEGHMFTSSLLGFIPNRISFHLNLKGPSMAVDTLCSSSLVAIHEACKSIINGECSMALAGGVYISFSPQHYILLSKMNVLSKDGKCKTFDESANGIVSGEGIGMLLLKPVQKAIEDRDNIHAIIKSSFINSDGRSSRFTTTNPEAQVDMISKAFSKSRINPESISYIETHGTGTTIGDPTEIMALKEAYSKCTQKKGFCYIGSVKSNIGHLEPAAGVAGIIKTILSLKNSKIPPTLNVNKVNHFIDIIDSPFVINDSLTKWESKDVRRAGVSAFGMGGTNAHIILEEAPYKSKQRKNDINETLDIFCISAKTQNSLNLILDKFTSYLGKKDIAFNEVCYTVNLSRTDFPYRTAIIAKSSKDLKEKMRNNNINLDTSSFISSTADFFYKHSSMDKRKVVFYLEGEIKEEFIDNTVKKLTIIKEELDMCTSVLQRNTSHKNISKLNQLYFKFIYFKTLMKLGVNPSVIVYSKEDANLVAILLDKISFERAVNNVISRRNELVEENNDSIIQLYDLTQWTNIEKKNYFTIEVPDKCLYESNHCFYSSLAYLYVNGIDIKWEKLYEGKFFYKLELPTYAFQKTLYLLDWNENRDETSKNKIKNNNNFMMLNNIYKSFECGIFVITFGEEDIEFFKDHNVLNKIIFPAAGYLDVVYRAGKEFYGQTVKQISDFVIYKPLEVKENTQLHIRLDKKGEITNFSLYSCFEEENGSYTWIEHAKGKFSLAFNGDIHESAIRERELNDLKPVNIEALYDYFKYTGIEYGVNFKKLKALRKNNRCVESEFYVEEDKELFGLNPSAIDAAFQTVVGFVFDITEKKNQPFLPFYIKDMVIFDNNISECNCKVIINGDNGEHTLKTNISIMGKSGKESIRVTGFNMKQRLDNNEGDTEISIKKLKKPTWVRTDKYFDKVEMLKGTYLIFDINNNISQDIKRVFKENGIDFIQVFKGDNFIKNSSKQYSVRPGNEDDIKMLFSSIGNDFFTLEGVMYLWSLECENLVDYNNVDEKISEGIISLFIIFKLIGDFKYIKINKFLVLTRTAWKIYSEDIVKPQNSAIWGFMRVAQQEFQSINSIVIDVNDSMDSSMEMATNIYNEVVCEKLEHEVAYRNNDRFQFEIKDIDELNTKSWSSLKVGGTYLITGGTGGIGFSLAENINSNLGINLILLGRTDLNNLKKDKIDKIKNIKKKVAKVEYISADVTNYASMKKAIEVVKSKYKKIDGVFHTAGEVRDGLLNGKSLENFTEVIAPKIKGVLILEDIFRHEDIDFVMLFSSVSSLEGIIGQCDYAAANAFMDGMAESGNYNTNYLSVNWSYWNVGMGEGYENIALRKGYKVLDPREASVIALKLAGSKMKRIIVEDKVKVNFKDYGKESVNLESYYEKNVNDKLITKLSKILDLSVEYLDIDTSFTDFGMDSLLAVKFIDSINEEFHMELDATYIFDYQSISKLSRFISENLKLEENSNVGLSIKTSYEVKECIDEDNLGIETNDISSILKSKLASILELEEDIIDDCVSFIDFGMDSILASKYTDEINYEFKINIDPTIVFDYPNINKLSCYIAEEFYEEVFKYSKLKCKTSDVRISNELKIIIDEEKKNKDEKLINDDLDFKNNIYGNKDKTLNFNGDENDIAIIGIGCKFPEADGLNEFWSNISKGVSISQNFPFDRVDNNLDIYKNNEYYKIADRLYGSYLTDIDKFDPLFFEISPKEAELMDPQQRVLLEVVWKAFEHAAYSKTSLDGTKTGVFVGACITEYSKYIKEYDGLIGTGNELSILANRISYIYNLKGPSITIDTACSSSLVALDIACESIFSGKCSMAVVAGINIILTPTFSIIFEKAGMLSKDGKCKTFDEDANGYLRGEGAGAIIIKPLKNAILDKDNILAVIKGTSINQDGHSNGLTAPNALSQEEVILNAWEKAKIDPRSISMVEAHGTGTSLGDPIEVKALTKSFRNFTKDNGFCAIGSVKTNIGHLEPAAGISGVIKVVLSLLNKKIPPICNFKRRNKLINFVESPFYINDKLKFWKSDGETPRRATVSSFGFGGTNAHVVIEEAPIRLKHEEENSLYSMILISAKNYDGMVKKLKELKKYLMYDFNASIEDLSYTLAVGRDHYNYRTSYIIKDKESLIREIEDTLNNHNKLENLKTTVDKNLSRKNITIAFGEKWSFERELDLNKLFKLYPYIEKDIEFIREILKKHKNIDFEQIITLKNTEKLNNEYENKIIYTFLQNYLIGKVINKIIVSNIHYLGIGWGQLVAKALHKECYLQECIEDLVILSNRNTDINLKIDTLNKYKNYELSSRDEIGNNYSLKNELHLLLGQNDFVTDVSNMLLIDDYSGDVNCIICNLLTSLYNKGYNFHWQEYYKTYDVHKISIPGYPLSKKRYWIGNKDLEDKHYTFINKSFIEKSLKRSVDNADIYIIINTNDIDIFNLKSKLEGLGKKCIFISQDNFDNYDSLRKNLEFNLNRLNLNTYRNIRIIHCDIYDKNFEYSRKKIYKGILSLFSIIRYLYDEEIYNVYILNIIKDFYCNDRETWRSLGAMSSAFCKIVPYEILNYKAKSIMIGSSYEEKDLLSEITNFGEDEFVYLNNHKRFVQNYKKLELLPLRKDLNINKNEVTIVTGGLRGIGFEICKHLILNKNTNLIIIGRTKAINENYNEIFKYEDKNEVRDKIEALRSMQNQGLDVTYLTADVCDYEAMKKIFDCIKLKYGKIDFIIHCAGVIDSKHISIRTKNEASIKDVLLPKLEGTLNTTKLAQDYEVKKVILFSSIASLAGFTGVGFSDYAVANAFMDVYSNSIIKENSSCNIISINWPAWRDIGMSNRGLTTKQGYSIEVEHGIKAFDEILNSEYIGNIIVAGRDAESFINNLNYNSGFKNYITEEHKELIKERNFKIDSKPKIDTNVDPKNMLKDLLKSLLKLSEDDICYETSFSEYGIDSISLADMLGGIEEHYDKHLEPSIILEYPNINLLSEYLLKNFEDKGKEKNIDSLDYKKIDLNSLKTPEILELLYKGEITMDEAWNYMLEHEVEDR